MHQSQLLAIAFQDVYFDYHSKAQQNIVQLPQDVSSYCSPQYFWETHQKDY